MNVLHKPVLSLETATPVCSAALRMPDGSITGERAEGRGVHSELTFVFIERLLQQAGVEVADLGAVLVSAGPGSYTGLRVGSSAVKGLLFDTEIPLYAYNSLAGIALGVRQKTGSVAAVDAVIDARRNHLYHQLWQFGDDGPEAGTGLEIRELDDVLERWKGGALIAGTGTERIRQLAESRDIDTAGLQSFPGTEVISAEWILIYVAEQADLPEEDTERVEGESGRADDKSGRVDAKSSRLADKSGRADDESGRVDDESGRVDDMSGHVEQKTGARNMKVIRKVDPTRFEPDYFSNL